MAKFKGWDLPAGRQAFKKISRNKTLKKTGMITGFAVLGLGLIIFGFNFAYKDKIFPQTYIGGMNLGGQTKDQALKTLNDQMVKSSKSQVELKYADSTWVIKTQDLDIKYDPAKSVDVAWQVGREGKFSQIVLEQLKSVFKGNFHLVFYDYNVGKLNAQISQIAQKIDVSERDASVKLEDLNPVVISAQSGKKLDYDQASHQILDNFGNLQNDSSFILPVSTVMPKVGDQAAQAAAGQVKNILVGNIELKSEKKIFTLTPKDYAPFLEFVGILQDNSSKLDLKNTSKDNAWALSVQVNPGQLLKYTGSIATDINQEPKDAKFSVVDGQVKAFELSQTGYQLDQQKARLLISAAILGLDKLVTLPVKITQPEITSDSATAMGLTELVGEGKTSWRGSPSNRIHNLTLGASKLSGIIVKPGEEFSTVKSISPITAEAGFLPELVIKNSTEVSPEIGGGLCQVSTTLFRAVLNSGLKVSERTNHSFRVSYYEPPVGMDATIYDPAPDFKFVNNMKTPILIWAFAGSNSLTFQIYGTKDNRKIEISDPVTYNFVPPGNPVYTESASMEPGTIRQVERATPGCTASFNYTVTSATGEVLQKETFVSKYVALANSYLVGAGYQAPPPEGG